MAGRTTGAVVVLSMAVPVVIGFTATAVAHVPKVSASCVDEKTVLSVELVNYEDKKNSLVITDNGAGFIDTSSVPSTARSGPIWAQKPAWLTGQCPLWPVRPAQGGRSARRQAPNPRVHSPGGRVQRGCHGCRGCDDVHRRPLCRGAGRSVPLPWTTTRPRRRVSDLDTSLRRTALGRQRRRPSDGRTIPGSAGRRWTCFERYRNDHRPGGRRVFGGSHCALRPSRGHHVSGAAALPESTSRSARRYTGPGVKVRTLISGLRDRFSCVEDVCGRISLWPRQRGEPPWNPCVASGLAFGGRLPLS
jgi:hypothetical protein